MRGEIRLVEGGGARRLVLMLGDGRAALCSNEVEMATDRDVLLQRRATGLPYRLIAQLDLVTEVEQVGASLGSVPLREVIPPPPRLRGLPCRGPHDPRWGWKLSELAELQRLSRSSGSSP